MILDHLSEGKRILEGLRPLPPAVTAEIKHRMEVRLTHHSTAIEGNTLTQSETEIVIEKGITIGGKSLREHLEIIGHKEALDYVESLSCSEEPIGERQIREIHTLVMKGESDAGGYRNLDVQAAGSEFKYPSHLHVPQLMSEFAGWLAGATGLHPVDFASEAHLRFVTSHPFRDGNGRVGRLLMNLLLLRAGYPVAVIPVQLRQEYIGALETAQAGGGRDKLDRLVGSAVESGLREILMAAAGSSETDIGGLLEIKSWLS